MCRSTIHASIKISDLAQDIILKDKTSPAFPVQDLPSCVGRPRLLKVQLFFKHSSLNQITSLKPQSLRNIKLIVDLSLDSDVISMIIQSLVGQAQR